MLRPGLIRYNVEIKAGVTFSMAEVEEYLKEYIAIPVLDSRMASIWTEDWIESVVNDVWDIPYSLYLKVNRCVLSFRVRDMVALPTVRDNQWYPNRKYSWMQILNWEYEVPVMRSSEEGPTMLDYANEIIAIIKPVRDFLEKKLNER